MLRHRNSGKDINQNVQQDNGQIDYTLNCSIEENIKLFKGIFHNDDTLTIRYFQNQKDNNVKCSIIFVVGMTDTKLINEYVIKPIVENTSLYEKNNVIDDLMYNVIVTDSIEKTSEVDKLIESIVNGDTVLLVDGIKEALAISTKGWKTRAIEEPESEKIIRGPREGFTESLVMNLTMLRRKILTPDLKFKFKKVGVRTHTMICLCYIEGIANEKILNELNKRLDNIDIDGILASEYIQEYIRDSPFSPFKTIGSTERPDKVAAKLLEGRIAIIVEGTPVALTVPYIFIEYFQANEDYYINFYYTSVGRLLRITGFIISISLPAIFTALLAYHQETIPTPLIMSITAARQGVPFPVSVETVLLLFVFELLRETGIRMPTNVGQALSIVGALVLGQAAVDARFVSAPIVIVVALTGISGLSIPGIKGASILIRIIYLFLASILGLYGYVFGMIGFLIHLLELRSFGVPYLYNLTSLEIRDLKDTAIRVPWIYMKYRPKFIAANNLIRKASGGKK